jgi:thiol-disulfide isomerase/thioredoxin
MRPGLRLPLAVAIVCVGGASGFLAAHLARVARTQGMVDTTPTKRPPELTKEQSQQDEPGVEGQAAPSRVIPAEVPNVSLAGVDGLKHALSEWKGRPLLINFWATWCEPCRREIPLLKTLRRERAADGVEIIGIAVDFRDAVQRYAHQMGIDYPVLVGEQDGLDAIARFGMDTVFPFTVFADRQGRIVTLKVGELHADDAHLILDEIKAVDQGRLELAAARKNITDGVANLAARRAQEQEIHAPGGDQPGVPRKSIQEVP